MYSLRCLLAFFALALVSVSPLHAAEPKVSQNLQPFVDKATLAGAVVLVASPDKVLAIETVGYADREAKTPMQPDNVFWIASMSKPMTAAGLMILVDEKKVELDAPVEKYLPEFKSQLMQLAGDKDYAFLHRPKRPPTVRDLLRHTSGMPFKSDLEDPTLDRFSLRDGVRSYVMTPLKYEPGTQHA
jgi:CubicO group peptidase (beta-lactamase class C family)